MRFSQMPASLRVMALAPLLAFPLLATPAEAGFLDFFFQGAGPQPGVPTDDPFAAMPQRRHAPAHPRITVVHKPNAAVSVDRNDVGKDPTLREGDAVMTATGIKIAAGGDRERHELVPLADTRGLSKTELKALTAIDKNRVQAGWTEEQAATALQTGRSASANAPLYVKDPQGKMVRYVGP